MGNVLAFCEFNGAQLRSSALANLSFARLAAKAHDGDVVALLVGAGAGAAAPEASKYAPRVVVVDDAALAHYLAETFAPVVAEVAKAQGATLVSATATAVGKDLAPRVAGLLDAGMASDVSKLAGKDTFVRPVLAGNAYSTVQIKTPIVVVSGGRGMKNGENFKVLEQLADLLGAAMGASRAATDAGMVPADWQVGQTGKIVAPNLYFAVAISGAIQHLAGMKGSKTIVAINKNKDEPIFQVADYGVVAEWEKAIPELISEIKKLKASR